jgi:cobalt-zinc-cadmium resistance protein CzcA
MRKLLDLALANRAFVLITLLLFIAIGTYSLTRLPIDAVPDVTNVQVQILTKSPSLGPAEVEQFITYPVEAAMNGLPSIQEVRSISRYGISAVTVVFKDNMPIYLARQLVGERLTETRESIPASFGRPEMGPITTGLGDIYQFTVEGDASAMDRRTALDWIIAPRLRAVPGVVEVNTWGGIPKQYEVVLDPARLSAFNVSLDEVFSAVEAGSAGAGGGYIEKNQQQYIIRGEGLATTTEDIADTVVKASVNGTPVQVKQLGEVRIGPMLRVGAATKDGKGETVIGLVQMLAGENALAVAADVRVVVDQIQPSLPKGMRIVPYYDRATLVTNVLHTVRNNLLEGAVLVILVLFLMLGNIRAGLIVAFVIPLSMLFAFTGMVVGGISGNLMSLGAIDFGLIVDGAVVLVENVVRRMGSRDESHPAFLTLVREASHEVARPVTFGVLIIILVYIPLLTLQGIEGKMFRPMAWTVVFALVGSLLLTVTIVPVLVTLFLKPKLDGPDVHDNEPRFVGWLRARYLRLFDWSITHRAAIIAMGLALLIASASLAPFLGAEFVPRLDEGDISITAIRVPGVALSESVASTTRAERVIRGFPEVVTAVSRSGSPELATDVMGVELSDIFVILKPRSEWKSAKTKEELVEKMQAALLKGAPGSGFSFTQPIEMRFNELIAGVKSDVAVKVFGDDLSVLRKNGQQIERILAGIPGAEDVKLEQTAGLPLIRVQVDRQRAARYGMPVRHILEAVESIRAGREAGSVFEGQRRFPLVVRLQDASGESLDAIRNIPVTAPSGVSVPLGQLASVTIDSGPVQISRESIRRRVVVEANVRGRDVASFVKEANARIAREVKLPEGNYTQWGGQFENLQAATRRLAVVVPLVLALIFVMLFFTFRSLTPALLIYLNVPFAATGGVLALAVRGMPFSISAAVGFIALFGVAVLNGIVLMSQIQQLRQSSDLPLVDIVREACSSRMRPVLMTALVAGLGFIPMALSHGTGAEVQRPLATVVIGGLITSTILTLLVLPTIYTLVGGLRRKESGEAEADVA